MPIARVRVIRSGVKVMVIDRAVGVIERDSYILNSRGVSRGGASQYALTSVCR